MAYRYQLGARIDASNATELDQTLQKEYEEHGPLELDARNLEYISSAGLRALLKLKKQQGELSVVNVSTAVNEIFEVTGFSNFLKIRRALRRISVEGCEVIGRGGTGTIYRTAEDMIVKVFNPGTPYSVVEQERDYARDAFISGVPTAIPFDVVLVGDCFGTVFEALNSSTLAQALQQEQDPARFEELMDKWVALAKKIHATQNQEGRFRPVQSILREKLERLRSYELCPEEMIDLYMELLDELPETGTLIHGDMHPANVMLHGDELMLIDMADITTGPGEYDVMALYRDLIMMPQKGGEEIAMQFLHIPMSLCEPLWKGFLRRYYEGASEEELAAKEQGFSLASIACSNMTAASVPKEYLMGHVPLMEQMFENLIKPNAQALKMLFRNLR